MKKQEPEVGVVGVVVAYNDCSWDCPYRAALAAFVQVVEVCKRTVNAQGIDEMHKRFEGNRNFA